MHQLTRASAQGDGKIFRALFRARHGGRGCRLSAGEAAVRSEVIAMPTTKHLRNRTSRGNCSSVHRTSGCLAVALQVDYQTFSAHLSDDASIANGRSDHDGFTPTTRSEGHATSTMRPSVPVVTSGRRMRASSVASGTAIIRRGRSTDGSNGRRRAPPSTKPPPYRRRGEL